MARYFDIHPDNPQRRSLAQVADIVRDGGVIAYPTDSCYALGCALGNKAGIERIREIRKLDDKHHLTLVCQDFAQMGQYVIVPNAMSPGSERYRDEHPERFAKMAADIDGHLCWTPGL